MPPFRRCSCEPGWSPCSVPVLRGRARLGVLSRRFTGVDPGSVPGASTACCGVQGCSLEHRLVRGRSVGGDVHVLLVGVVPRRRHRHEACARLDFDVLDGRRPGFAAVDRHHRVVGVGRHGQAAGEGPGYEFDDLRHAFCDLDRAADGVESVLLGAQHVAARRYVVDRQDAALAGEAGFPVVRQLARRAHPQRVCLERQREAAGGPRANQLPRPPSEIEEV